MGHFLYVDHYREELLPAVLAAENSEFSFEYDYEKFASWYRTPNFFGNLLSFLALLLSS
jgi:hypothetical protein